MRNEQEKRFAVDKPIKLKSQVVECAEQGRYCMKKFIPTRPGQTDTCIKCMEMLGTLEPLPVNKTKKNLWT